eukprot:GILK01010871.1.p1 GENE.GILK01010871.1~~GILK01010871.1.p1  ORF type:complete len:169 (-),score=5.42 GILK01010871.1:50-556(-)
MAPRSSSWDFNVSRWLLLDGTVNMAIAVAAILVPQLFFIVIASADTYSALQCQSVTECAESRHTIITAGGLIADGGRLVGVLLCGFALMAFKIRKSVDKGFIHAGLFSMAVFKFMLSLWAIFVVLNGRFNVSLSLAAMYNVVTAFIFYFASWEHAILHLESKGIQKTA